MGKTETFVVRIPANLKAWLLKQLGEEEGISQGEKFEAFLKRTMLKAQTESLKEIPKPQVIEKIVEKIVEKPADLDQIKLLEAQINYWKDEAKNNAKAYNQLLMEGYYEEKEDLHSQINQAFNEWKHGQRMPQKLRELLRKDGSLLQMKS